MPSTDSQRVVIPMLYYYPDHPSGSSRMAFDEAVFLAQHGHEVWVVAQDQSGRQPEYAFREGLHVLQYQQPRVGPFDPRRAQAHQLRTADLLTRHLGDRIDAMHGHALLTFEGVCSIYPREVRRAYSVHSPMKLEFAAAQRGAKPLEWLRLAMTARLTHRMERRCLDNADVITANSDFTRRLLAEHHTPELADRIQVVPGWVDVERFRVQPDRDTLKQEFGWPVDVPVLFTLRRLVPRNGVDMLLHALKRVRDKGKDFHMVIGGAGPMRYELEDMAAHLGLTGHVRFLGRVGEIELPLMYAAADAFVLPTTSLEGFGLIMVEALAAGRPVLATPVGAIPEVLEPIEPAWLAENNSARAIADLIISYLEGSLPQHDPDSLHQYVAEHYASHRVIPRLIKVALDIDTGPVEMA